MLKVISQWGQLCARRILYLSTWKLYLWCLSFVILTTLPTMNVDAFMANWPIYLLMDLVFARVTMLVILFWVHVCTVLEKLATLMHMIDQSEGHEELEYCRDQHMKLLGHTRENLPLVAFFCRPAFLGTEKFIRDTKRYNDEKDENE